MKIVYLFIYSFVIILVSILVFYNNNYFALVKDKYVSFTFDDGPGEYTKDIVYLLNKNNYSATFFMIGDRLKENMSVIDYIESMGSEVGIHGMSHSLINSEKEALNEYNSNYLLLYSYTNRKDYLYRPSYGAILNKYIINRPYILWNKDTLDWSVKDRYVISNYILNNIEEYDIFLMHDIYEETYGALKIVIPILKERGYIVTSISNIARKKGCSFKNNSVYYNLKECL